jgi:Amt family ammonium transporter
MDASLGAVCFWLLGYGFAYGKDYGGFIGTSNFGVSHSYSNAGGAESDGYESWFFQWAFAGAAATIVAGSVAERTKVAAYFMYTIALTTLIYPIVVHWGWGSGWLSAWGAFPDEKGNPRPIFRYNSDSNGMIDFAGSGIVHMVGGFSGLTGAIIVGPRIGRFDPATRRPYELTNGNKALQALGTLILWFGWWVFLSLLSCKTLASRACLLRC